MAHYLGKSIKIYIADQDIESWESRNPNSFGYTIEDIEDGKLVKLNSEQIEFMLNNSDATYVEIFKAKLDISKKIEKIREKREYLYKKYSDSLYMAYLKYKELGMENKAIETKNKWMDMIKSIKSENPYPD